ncbi:hypothetical protein SAMN05216464_109278 [Mucilaginibacter pineti]|uniref:Uncharacterized protein n=1 Tax=Mucilaginibacter pineti TaxID=1391627 RepID=A0A1G7FYS6_9SPHI|nr:hypothetical protein [Mucilaginibacter pineti]SDE80952.1 hypothetical protein SAMN05216464_109278 [Mucilaginibacter pineti]
MKIELYNNKANRKVPGQSDSWKAKSSSWANTNDLYKEPSEAYSWLVVRGNTPRTAYIQDVFTDTVESEEITHLKNPITLKTAASTQPIWHESKFLGLLDNSFSLLIKEINDSKYILNQKIDSEDKNSGMYSSDSWIRGIKFIIKYANHVFSKEKQCILTPKIYHGPEGSIDFYWDYSHLNMLVNIPLHGDASFSLDDNGTNKINGFFNPDEPMFKFLPLAF